MDFLLEIIASFQAFPALLKYPVAAAAVLLALTFFGRIYCRYLCVFGALQSLVNMISRPRTFVRRVCTRLPESRMQRFVRWLVFVIFVAFCAAGYSGLAYMFEPWSIFGKAVNLFLPGLVVFVFVLLLAAFTSARFWCNWICPLGTVFNLLSRLSRRGDKIGSRCANCRACFKSEKCSSGATGEGKENSAKVTRRQTLHGVAVLAAAKIGDGGFADVSLPGVPNRKRSVLPPGAVKRASFLHKCLGCGLCIGVCPGQCLKQSFKFGSFGQVELDFTEGYCRINCDSKCARVCPSGAIELLGDVERKDIHMGHALFKKDLCVRVTNGDPCTACERKCPVKAIKIVAGFPVVDKSACIGCGACEHVCPARPMPAIFVSGFENQRVVTKMGETDLIKEMALLVDRGDASAVVAKNGVIVAIEKGSGVRPLMALFEKGVLEGAIVADKVIGRAAAAILAAGKVKTLYASLLSDDALDILESAGIKWTAGERTSKILNRAKTGCCPFEDMVKGKTDPTEIVEIVRKALNK